MSFSPKEYRDGLQRRFMNSYGWDEERARQVADMAADHLNREYGGQKHYIPSRPMIDKEKLRAEFNGRNVHELSRRYGISAMTVRNYLKKS